MAYRIIVVSRDQKYASWLRHHIDTIWPDCGVRLLDVNEFSRKRRTLTDRDCDLIFLDLEFGDSPEDPKSEGLFWLRELRKQSNLPSLVAVAQDGNELTAVRAMRLGAVDYLPRRLLTSERIKQALQVIARVIERRVEAAMHSDVAANAPGPNFSIPRYRLQERLGASDKATVFKAFSDESQSDVAIKVINAEVANQDQERQRLAREFAAIAALEHPSIVQIYDYGVHEGREYLVMEYFARGDLKARMRDPLNANEALRYVTRIAQALEVVHAAGLIHRDLKPHNVMLRDNDDIVLIDFGLAREANGEAGSTRTGVLRGSPYYMSPEQAQGMVLDARTDLYSLGVIFFELLAERKPFTGATAMEVLNAHVTGDIPRLPDDVSEFQSIIDRLLAKRVEDRFASAEALIDALREMRRDEDKREAPEQRFAAAL
ncbi:MAG: protein kinase [Steroidobacteraceae bacterium]